MLVTHRVAAVCHVDRIFVMDEGRLVEQGRHTALFAAGPPSRYARMFRLQAGQYDHESLGALPRPTKPSGVESNGGAGTP